MLDTGTRSSAPYTSSLGVESSFKHYVSEADNGPEVINVTSQGGTILPPDQVIDVSRAPSMVTLNNGKDRSSQDQIE